MRTQHPPQQSGEERFRPAAGTDATVAPVTGRRPTRRGRWAAVVAGVVVLAVAAGLGFVLVGDGERDGDEEAAPVSTAPSSTESPTSAEDEAVEPAPTSPPPAQPSGAVIEDGRHPVYLTGIDVGARTMEFDLIQFLTGDEAVAAWDAAHSDAPGGPPNDYLIVNDNPKLRELPVAGDVTVTVLDWDGGFLPMSIAFEDLPHQLAGDVAPDDAFLWPNPFWLTVDDGAITAVEEQYTP